jgi:hypothetical protein
MLLPFRQYCLVVTLCIHDYVISVCCKVIALRVGKVDVEWVSDVGRFVQAIVSRLEPVKSWDRIASSVSA